MTNVTLSFELSQLAGVVDATVTDLRRGTAGTVIAYDLGSIALSNRGSAAVPIPLRLRAAAGATAIVTAGESDRYTLTTSADGVDPVSSGQPAMVKARTTQYFAFTLSVPSTGVTGSGSAGHSYWKARPVRRR